MKKSLSLRRFGGISADCPMRSLDGLSRVFLRSVRRKSGNTRSGLFSPDWLRQTRSILANAELHAWRRVKAFALQFFAFSCCFWSQNWITVLFLHNFRSRGRLTYYYRGTGRFLGGDTSLTTLFVIFQAFAHR